MDDEKKRSIEKIAKIVVSNITPFPKSVTKEQIRYDELQTLLFKLVPIDDAKRIIKIVEEDSSDIYRRIAFLEVTIDGIAAGADCSKVKTIENISELFAISLLRRLGF